MITIVLYTRPLFHSFSFSFRFYLYVIIYDNNNNNPHIRDRLTVEFLTSGVVSFFLTFLRLQGNINKHIRFSKVLLNVPSLTRI